MIGEHSYSRPQMPVAEGRPDALDLEEAVRFGENVSGRIGLYCGSVLPERLIPLQEFQQTYESRDFPAGLTVYCITGTFVQSAGVFLSLSDSCILFLYSSSRFFQIRHFAWCSAFFLSRNCLYFSSR